MSAMKKTKDKEKEEVSQVLYRKYRPQKFDEVVDQDHIVESLKNALSKNTVAHAYLFHGGRGTGKTTIARILAKEFGTSANDLVEIDAASNRKIEDIRELREGVKTLPFESQYKVYIIDEVHMLTNEAFNALLKTLEEPPQHVKFILATTELHKIPETILSRCEVHTFNEPHLDTLTKVVKDVVRKEEYKITDDAATHIAKLGEGSFRDTLGVLQKVIAGSNKKSGEINMNDVASVSVFPAQSLVRNFISNFVDAKKAEALEVFHQVLESHISPRVFMKHVLHVVRMGLLLKISKSNQGYVFAHISKADLDLIEDLVNNRKEKFNSKLLLSLLDAYEIMDNSPIPELAVEIAIDAIDAKS
jgi:DNA polymerase III subunit gamma/tau